MKLDRLIGILTVLMQTDNVTAPQLAEKFEVNRRTIGRDIDALCRAGIPVVTRQGNGGGISVASGFKLDKSILTADELSGIIAALKGIGSVTARSRTERILDKLNAGGGLVSLREPVIINLGSYHKTQLTEKIETIKRAVLEQKIIEFVYYYEKGEARKKIEPYFIVFNWTSWYVFGFCLERRDWRMFKLMRLYGLQTSGEIFTPREIPEEQRDFDLHFTDEIKLAALFDPSEKYQLIENYGLDCFTETEDGLLFEMGFTNRRFVIRWLLGFGGAVKVLQPEDIAGEIKAEARKILNL